MNTNCLKTDGTEYANSFSPINLLICLRSLRILKYPPMTKVIVELEDQCNVVFALFVTTCYLKG